MTAKDPALLWYGSEFYEDEHVLRMTFEQQGVYLRLLWIAQRNDGLPADPAALAEMLQLPAKRFLERVWPRIAPCWIEVDGRLRNPRQERDRARREATRAPADGGGSPPPTTRERMQQLARQRWDKRRAMRDADAAPHAHADASRIADADAADDAARNAARIPLPTPHPPISSEAKPQPHARASAAPHAASHRDAHAEGGASAARPAAEPAAAEPDTAETAALAALQNALLATAYRSGVGNPFRRRAVVFDRAEQLFATGLTAALLVDLERLADAKGTGAPGSLLAHWLDENLWREVLDEQTSKQKQRSAQARTAADPDQEPVAAGALVAASILGAEPIRRTS